MISTVRRRLVYSALVMFIAASIAAGAQQTPKQDLGNAIKQLYIILYSDPGYGDHYVATESLDKKVEYIGKVLYGDRGWVAIRQNPSHKLIERYYVALFGSEKGSVEFHRNTQPH